MISLQINAGPVFAHLLKCIVACLEDFDEGCNFSFQLMEVLQALLAIG